MTSENFTTTNVDIVEVEPRRAAIVRKAVSFADIPRAQREARKALDAALASANMQPSGPTLTVWRTPQDGKIDYAPGVFVPRGLSANGDVSLFELPQGRAAHLSLIGSYEALPEAWSRLFKSVNGQPAAGLNWEIYSAAEGSPEQYRTDLYALLA